MKNDKNEKKTKLVHIEKSLTRPTTRQLSVSKFDQISKQKTIQQLLTMQRFVQLHKSLLYLFTASNIMSGHLDQS